MKAVTLKTLCDQDWKTQLARGYSNIPVNVVVDVINTDFQNLYGNWCEVMWNNHKYYVSKSDLSFDELDVQRALDEQNDIAIYQEKFK